MKRIRESDLPIDRTNSSFFPYPKKSRNPKVIDLDKMQEGSSRNKKVLSFFSHSSHTMLGSERTSVVSNMAVKASQTKKVMLIDLDPGMAVTEFFSSYIFNFDAYVSNLLNYANGGPSSVLVPEGNQYLEMSDFYTRNIFGVLDESDDDEGYLSVLNSIKKKIGYPITSEGKTGLTLLTGHPLLWKYDQLVQTEFMDNFRSTKYSSRLRSLFNFLLESCGFDCVFVNVGICTPSLTKVALMQSDFMVAICGNPENSTSQILALSAWLQDTLSHTHLFGEFPSVVSVVFTRFDLEIGEVQLDANAINEDLAFKKKVESIEAKGDLSDSHALFNKFKENWDLLYGDVFESLVKSHSTAYDISESFKLKDQTVSRFRLQMPLDRIWGLICDALNLTGICELYDLTDSYSMAEACLV